MILSLEFGKWIQEVGTGKSESGVSRMLEGTPSAALLVAGEFRVGRTPRNVGQSNWKEKG